MAGFPNALPGDTTAWSIPNCGQVITGHSRAGERTGFGIKTLGVYFDAGLSVWAIPKFIFITHSHTDHSFSLPMMTATLSSPATAYVPEEAVTVFQNHLRATAQLNACSLEEQPLSCEVIGVKPGDELRVSVKSMQWKIQVIRCPHRVPSVGYCVSDVRKTLKPEYKGLSQKEIGQLKKSGVEIVETTEFRLFAFMGDTTPELFELHPEVFGFPTIFVECTFWDHREDDHLEAQAAKTTHIHWNKLKPVIQAHPECLFMLIHFTLRYDETQIAEFFKRESEQNQLYNFALWLDAGVLEFKPPSQNTE